MRRFSWLFVFLLGSAQYVSAQQMPAQSLPAQPASAPAAAAAASDASAPLAANQPNEENRRITSYLMKKFGVAREKAAKLADIVNATATKYALPPALVYAIISIESRFQEKARGGGGATGLMQVVPSAHRGLLRNVKDLTEPNANINAGSAILSGYVKAAGGDIGAALKSYGGSHAYASKVLQRVESFRFVLEPRDDANAGMMPVSAPASDVRAVSVRDSR